jgi:hypothetical protein
MQDLVRQKFEESLSDPEERKILFELGIFGAKFTQKEVNMLEKMSRFLSKALKVFSEINPFNKSE